MKRLPLLALVLVLTACTQSGTTDQVQVEWQSVQTGTGAYDMPLTQVSLVDPAEGTILFRTDCEGTAAADTIEETGDMAVLCWWAGGGERFTVVKRGNILTVRNQQVDEESGYGEWTDVETIEL